MIAKGNAWYLYDQDMYDFNVIGEGEIRSPQQESSRMSKELISSCIKLNIGLFVRAVYNKLIRLRRHLHTL